MDDKPVYRMSSCGACPRKLSAIRLGYAGEAPPAFLMIAAEEGHWHEERIKTELRAAGYPIGSEQMEVRLEYASFALVGHIDGRVETDSVQLLEIKSMGQFEFERWMRGRWQAFPGYADQLTVYMVATGHNEALYIVKNRSSGYRDSFVQEGYPSDFDAILQKLFGVEMAVQAGQLIEAEYDPSSFECKRCEFRNLLCLVSKEQLTEATERELLAAVERFRRGKALREEADKLIDEGKQTLEDHAEATSPEAKFSYVIAKVQVSRYRVPAFGDAVSYPKRYLEEIIPEEYLMQVRETKPASWQCRITDLEAKDEV